VFRPDKLRFLTLTLVNGKTLAPERYACLSCGAVWSQTNPDALKDFKLPSVHSPAAFR
jgi:hypothetical protein